MNKQFRPFPQLSTARLTLRELLPEDEHEVFVQRSDARILEFLDLKPAETLQDAQQFIQMINEGVAKNNWLYWVLTLNESPQFIGTICLWNISTEKQSAEIGYSLHPDFQGKGYMQEAVEAVLAYGFEDLGAQVIEAFSHKKNWASLRLLERNGFAREGDKGVCWRYYRVAVPFAKTGH